MVKNPVAIGGVGGSGTRLIAQFLHEIGYFIGTDLSVARDNLWFALLFGRRDILLTTEQEFADISELFFRQMSEPRELTPDEIVHVEALSRQVRCQHSPELLHEWAQSFIAHGHTGKKQELWGWKVPYTHVVVDRLLAIRPNLKYVHVNRDGFDMAFSGNQNQLETWGPVFLNREIERIPTDSLSYWCCVHRRIAQISKLNPGRIFDLNFDSLVKKPDKKLPELLSFLEIDVDLTLLENFCQKIIIPKSIGRHKNRDKSDLLSADLKYLESIVQGELSGNAVRETQHERNDVLTGDQLKRASDLENEIIRSKKLKPGDDNYRAYVGPPDQYDFMGASQFRLLTSLGLREEHRVVDVGCGSLRLGKFLMQYLMPDRYIGIEPNEWLWQTVIRDEVGSDVVSIKRPKFFNESDFSLHGIDEISIDFIVAQSVYSHAGFDKFSCSLIAAARVIKPNGQFLFTVLSEGAPGFGSWESGTGVAGWVYPQCVTYPEQVVVEACREVGLYAQKLSWYHPRQHWYRATADEGSLLTSEMDVSLGAGRPLFDARFG